MYLSKLEIFGFKSFAQKVNLSFDQGLTAIVGPNGCGKTNVVDAIRWVLGEQRPTTLRSDKMEDVIFNGTKSRKPLNVAEVSITIENTKGILPSEYSEVTITRRVFRSGESEYYLNKTLCRLKDIRDLFMDTGMGSDAYSVIELKMVESILSDNSDERRRLFEESAGVTKYKYRRKEAFRRLDVVRQDLTRVNDIIRGVEKAVNSLERQAQKAEKYNEVVKQLQTLELDLLVRDFSSVVLKIEPLTQQLSVAVNEKNRLEVEVRQEETLLDVLRQESEELERQLTATQEDLSTRQTAIHELEQNCATSEERRRSLLENIERYNREKIELSQQRVELEKKQAELMLLLEQLQAKIYTAEEAYHLKKTQLDEFEKQLNAKQAELKTNQEQVIALMHELAELRNRENQVKARMENIRGRVSYTAEENTEYRRDIEKNSGLIAALSAENKQLRLAFAEAEVRTHKMEDYKQKLQDEIEQLRRQDHEIMGDVERKQARIDFLKGLVESFDGYSEGAKYLITSNEWSTKIQTTVGEAVQTEPQYRIAIETALGEAAGFVVVDNVQEAYVAIDFLKKNNKGKATFICLDRLPSISNHRLPIQSAGVVGWASSLVKFDNHHERLFNFLFDETLLVSDVPAALKIVNDYPNVRCITLEGEIVTGKGVVRGGSVRQDEGGHISKKSQLEEFTADVRKLRDRHEHVTHDLQKKIEDLEHVNMKKLAEEARGIEQQKTTLEIRIAQIEFEKKRAQDNIERNDTEAEKLGQEIDFLDKEIQSLTPFVSALERRQAEAEQQVGAAMSEVETMDVLWNEYSGVAHEANLMVLALKSEERSILHEKEYTAGTVQTVSSTFDQRNEEIFKAKEDIGTIDADLQAIDVTLREARQEYEGVLERKKTVDQDFSARRNQIHEIELKLKDERLKQEGSLKSAHDLEIKIQELTMKSENLKVRAKEDFDIDIQPQEFPDADQYDFSAAREEARTLKEKVHALGAVNFAAFDEYKSEKERLDFIAAQRDDLEQSEKTVLETINEINTTAQKQFLQTFELIRENFITTFKSLFDEGDECDLRLDGEELDPLEARIEIIAKPRGKRPTSIDLLSGGEKTLTAIALLFAIYLVKPSPFCILDEVDAPLDDSNIDRFVRILRKFSDNTQFVVVTHNKRSMEATNAMYGVTMEEEGISKLVSVRFNEVEKN
jgi:chromosome segregation protein